MVKLEDPVNRNYAAVVVKIQNLIQLDNCDNVQATNVMGYQAIIGRDVEIGDIGIVFPAETQLSDAYVRANNLYRHSELNVDTTQKGYLEDNRRVKAMKFRGHRSDALFMPLSSLSYIKGLVATNLNVGDCFDQLLGEEICRKYVVKVPQSRVEKNKLKAKQRRVDEKFLPRHFDTDNYFRNKDAIPAGTEVIVTAKLHGTSVRLGLIPVERQLNWLERLLLKLRLAELE